MFETVSKSLWQQTVAENNRKIENFQRKQHSFYFWIKVWENLRQTQISFVNFDYFESKVEEFSRTMEWSSKNPSKNETNRCFRFVFQIVFNGPNKRDRRVWRLILIRREFVLNRRDSKTTNVKTDLVTSLSFVRRPIFEHSHRVDFHWWKLCKLSKSFRPEEKKKKAKVRRKK